MPPHAGIAAQGFHLSQEELNWVSVSKMLNEIGDGIVKIEMTYLTVYAHSGGWYKYVQLSNSLIRMNLSYPLMQKVFLAMY